MASVPRFDSSGRFVPPGLFATASPAAAKFDNPFDSPARLEILAGQSKGDKIFWVTRDGYQSEMGQVTLHPNGVCELFASMWSPTCLQKENYVLWLPRSTIEALRDPLVICPLKYANCKPIEEHNTNTPTPTSTPTSRLDRIEERIKTLENAVSKLTTTTTTAPTPTLPDGFKPLKDLIADNIPPGTRVVHGVNPEVDFKIPVPEGSYAFVVLYAGADKTQTKPIGAKFVDADYVSDSRYNTRLRECCEFYARIRGPGLPDGFKLIKDMIVDEIPPGTRILSAFTSLSYKIPVPKDVTLFIALYEDDDTSKSYPIAAKFGNEYEEAEMLRASGYNAAVWMI